MMRNTTYTTATTAPQQGAGQGRTAQPRGLYAECILYIGFISPNI